ncbi:MAG: hypothetical protein KJ002_02300 [Candidatus Dadabacteria bacterium]|jgi:hypothetical protein|nr:hypothetical protein [Candidatus Dadabacteria bacterium]
MHEKYTALNKPLYCALCITLLILYLLSISCDEGGGGKNHGEPVAAVVERSRDVGQTNDFLRLIFLPADVTPTTLGRPDALRVFVSVASYFEPPLSLFETAGFFGIPVSEAQRQMDLVALRCLPEDPSVIQPSLATWPRVFELLTSDLGGEFICPPGPDSPANELYCLAAGFEDVPGEDVSEIIENAIGLGAAIMSDPAPSAALRQVYGIDQSFSGLGFSVNASAGNEMTAARALEASVVTEYLVKNATFEEAGCFCMRVPPYEGREDDPLDADFIVSRGGFGECKTVDRLGRSR